MGLPDKLFPWAQEPALAVQGRFGERLSQEYLLPFSGSERLKRPALESRVRKGPELGAQGGESWWLAVSSGGKGPAGRPSTPHQGEIRIAKARRSGYALKHRKDNVQPKGMND